MPKFDEQLETVYAKDRHTWREWLEKNHCILPGIWLIYYKVNLKQALEANETANRNFDTLNNSLKKNILFWIDSAKRPETRLNRIEKTVSSVVQNKNPLTQ